MDYSAPAFIPGNKEWFFSVLLFSNYTTSDVYICQSFLLSKLKKRIPQRYSTKKIFLLFDVSLQSLVYSTSYTMFFLYCESSDTHGSLLHTWSIENIQRCELSTPNAPGKSEKTLQRDFPDRAVPIALLNAQLWYVCVRFWLDSDWSIYDFERTLGSKI